MPDKGYLISLIDNLTLVALICITAILLIKKGWDNKLLFFIGVNALYSISLFLLGYFYDMESSQYGVFSNLTMHIDTLSGFGFFYFLWDDKAFRKFLTLSILPVLVTWLLTLVFRGIYKTPYWNLMLPSLWFLLAAVYAMLLLYRKSQFNEGAIYTSKFLLIAGFLFYNFIYLVIETCYLFVTSMHSITDAWNINYWGYFIFRLLMLAGILSWYFAGNTLRANLATVRK